MRAISDSKEGERNRGGDRGREESEIILVREIEKVTPVKNCDKKEPASL